MTPTNSLERIIAMWENRAAGHVRRIRELEAERDEWQRRYTDLEARVQAAEARTRELEAALADLSERGASLEARYREAVEQARIALAEAREAATFYLDGLQAATEYATELEAENGRLRDALRDALGHFDNTRRARCGPSVAYGGTIEVERFRRLWALVAEAESEPA